MCTQTHTHIQQMSQSKTNKQKQEEILSISGRNFGNERKSGRPAPFLNISKTVAEKDRNSFEEPEVRKDCSKVVSSGHVREMALTYSITASIDKASQSKFQCSWERV